MLGFQYETTLSFSLFLLSRNKKAFHPAFFTKPYIFGRLLIYIHRSVACTGSLQYWRAVALISRKGHTRITARKWSLVIDRISQHLTGCFGEIRNNGQQCRSASCYSTSLLRTWAKKLFSKRSIPAGRKLSENYKGKIWEQASRGKEYSLLILLKMNIFPLSFELN